MRSRAKYLILIVPFLFIGCSNHKTNQIPARVKKLKNLTAYPANTKPEETISFKEDAVYGSTKKVLIGQMGRIAVDSSGRVFIAVKKLTIDVFEPDGRFLTQVGRNGKGPALGCHNGSELESVSVVGIKPERQVISPL